MTAVEFIEDYLKFKGLIIDDKTIPQVLIGIIKNAKEIEKKQIIDAHGNQTKKSGGISNHTYILTGEEYYDKTFKSKEEPKQELPQLGTKEFNDLASAYFGGKPKQEFERGIKITHIRK